MTTSAIYTKTAGDIIEEALRDAKIIPSEQPINEVDYQNGLDSLNNISKFLQTKGIHYWLQQRAVLPLNTGQKVYELGPDGDPCGYEDTFFPAKLNADAAEGDTEITVDATIGMEAAPNILESSPVISTQDWEAINNATLSIAGGGLRFTNVSSTAGGAEYALTATVGQTYRVRFTFSLGTSSSCTVSVLNGGVIADSVTLTASDSRELTITAETTEITFKAQNVSTTTGQYSTITALQYVDETTGSRCGVVLDSGVTQWTYVLDVDSDTVATLTDPLDGAASSGNQVYSFTQQIDRPLQLFNVTYSYAIANSEVPVNRWSRQEYTQQPVKNSRGTVTNWNYVPYLNEGKLYVWQTAASNTNVLRFDVRRPLVVYSEISDQLDYPSEYFMAIKWMVAADLAPSYGVTDARQKVLENRASTALEAATDNDNEFDSVYVSPDWSGHA